MSEQRQYKAFEIENKQIDGRVVEGLAAIIGNVDSGNDRIHRGAFTETVSADFKRVKHLWQHDSRQPPIAVIEDLREVGKSELPSDLKSQGATGGLLVRRRYLNTERASEVFEGVISGAINEMSFAYDALEWDVEEVKDVGPVRNLRKIQLWDTSDVVWGMNALTVASKSKAEILYESLKAEYVAADKEPPAFEVVEFVTTLGEALEAKHLSALFDASEIEGLARLYDTLQRNLKQQEPEIIDGRRIKQRIAIARHRIKLIGGN